jgi:hypothetical protein
MKHFLNKYPIYLFLLPVFFLLHNHNQLPFFIPITFYNATPFLRYLILGILLFVLGYLYFKAIQKAAISTFFILILLLFFGVYHDGIKNLLGNSLWSSYKVALPAAITGLAVGLYFLFKRTSLPGNVTHYLSGLMILLVAFETGILIKHAFQYRKESNLITNDFSLNNNYKASTMPDSLKPDIYFIVFDEYAGDTTLNALFGFTNHVINKLLEAKGFYKANHSKSNYDFTPFCLASTFNMNYLPVEKGRYGNNPHYILQAIKSMSVNQLFSVLRKEGYTIYFKAPFDNSIEDYRGVKQFTDFDYKQLYQATLLYRARHDILWNVPMAHRFVMRLQTKEAIRPAAENYQQRVKDFSVLRNFVESIPGKQNNHSPKFVYAHFLVTHVPHLLDSLGNSAFEKYRLLKKADAETYLDQVKYANTLITSMVDSILGKGKKNTLIIIQADHGYRYMGKDKLAHHFPIQNWFYFPDSNYRALYPSISPVNTFRLVLNQYFKQQYPLLKDSSIVVQSMFRQVR